VTVINGQQRRFVLNYDGMIGTSLYKSLSIASGFGLSILFRNRTDFEDAFSTAYDNDGNILNTFTIASEDLVPRGVTNDVMDLYWCSMLNYKISEYFSVYALGSTEFLALNISESGAFNTRNNGWWLNAGLAVNFNGGSKAKQRYWNALLNDHYRNF
jgi:hypothetical protein